MYDLWSNIFTLHLKQSITVPYLCKLLYDRTPLIACTVAIHELTAGKSHTISHNTECSSQWLTITGQLNMETTTSHPHWRHYQDIGKYSWKYNCIWWVMHYYLMGNIYSDNQNMSYIYFYDDMSLKCNMHIV